MEPVNLNDLERIGRLLHEGKIDQNDYAVLKQEIIHGAQAQSDSTSGGGAIFEPAAALVDRYEVALSGEVDRAGWYPDPDQMGTHMRFFDGEAWTDTVKERRRPGWYRDAARPRTHQVYWDGLAFTNEYRVATGRELPPRSYRWWLGVTLVVLAGLSVVAVSVNDPELTATGFVLSVILNPLVWAGVGGVFLMKRDAALQRTK